MQSPRRSILTFSILEATFEGGISMLAKYRVIALSAIGLLLFTSGAWAQISAIEGDVKDPSGQPVKGASILIERKDMKGTYKGAKTDKKGHYIYNGLPLGTYKVSLIIDGNTADSVDNVHTKLGDPVPVNFDMKAAQAQKESMQKAAAEGTLTKEQERSMTKEQKEALEKQLKANKEAMAKNKALNDAFNGGMTALEAHQYDQAIDSFKKAGEVDPKQEAVWANLARAYNEKADGEKKPDEAQQRQTDLQGAADAYQKALELKPDDAALHLNLALVYAGEKKIDDAKSELQKAATLDPTQAGKAYYNLGAILINSGQNDAAGDAFKTAIEKDPNYADAYYQYGIVLLAKMKVGSDGKMVYAPGNKEAFEKYLELKPSGPHAPEAQEFIKQMGGTIDTTYNNPNAPKKPATKKK
jgi:tetratricopeptide (TPR) repeat protein